MKASSSLPVLYRPKYLKDIIGNKSNVSVIEGQFKKRRVTKTWMMAGPPGSGKTTVARIMAMTLNCASLKGIDPCMKCRSCKSALNDSNPDIHEVNLAGEQGKVEGIREILNLIKYQPQNNFRIIIADEVQGATPGTKKEILKSLEQPPSHVIWILCTMHPEQLSEAIHGRCLSLYWSYPNPKDINQHLYNICKVEYRDILKIIKPYIKVISENSSFQPRKSIQMLEAVASAIQSKKYTKKSDINKLIETYIKSVGNLDVEVIRFVNYILCDKKMEPFKILSSLEENRIQEFLILIHTYTMYAANFYLAYKANEKVDKSKFYGVSFIRFDNSLMKLKDKVDDTRCFRLCYTVNNMLEKLRQGILPSRNIATSFMYEYFNR